MRQTLSGALVLVSLLCAAEARAEEPVRVRLVEPGRAPLKVLRYRARAGQTAHVSMTMKMGMAVKVAGQALPSTPVPEMRCGIAVKVTEVTPAGDIKYDFQYDGFEVVSDPATPPAVLEAMRKLLAPIKGLRGHGVITSRGFAQEGRVEVPPDADPQLKQMIEGLQQSMKQFSAPMPEEPVGVGARWETTYEISQRGLRVDQVAKNELKSMEGDRLALAVVLTQSAPPQPMKLPELPASARMDLVSLASSGEGTSALDLAGLIPTSAAVKLQMLMKTRMQIGEQPAQDMEMTMDMAMNLTGR